MKASLAFLAKNPHFKPLIQKHGPPKLRRGKNAFQALARSIIYQQISGKAASSIYGKFVAFFGIELVRPVNWEDKAMQRFPTPHEILVMPEEKMRSAGLSAQKVSYLKDLALKFSDGTIDESLLENMSSENIVTHLTKVKGIGVWTVHMFLIFSLNRPDVLPTGDLGIRKGFQVLYKMRSLPTPAQMEKRAKGWREHASVASWYLWRIADEAAERRKKSP